MSNNEIDRLRSFRRTTTRGAWLRPCVALGMAALACSMVAVSAGNAGAVAKAKASPALSSKAKTVKPDVGFYKGKTITFYEWGSVGSAPDLQARLLAPYIGAYLHAQVNVDSIAGGGTIPGQNQAAAAIPNGLNLGELNPTGDIGDFVYNTPRLSFNLRDQQFLPSPMPLNTALLTTPASGFRSFDQVVHSSKPVSLLAEVNSSSAVWAQLLFGAYKIPNHFIYGYSSGAAIVAGFTRGDGDAKVQAFSTFQSLLINQQAHAVFQSTPAIKGSSGYAIFKKIPTLEQYAATNPPKTKDQKAELAMLERLLYISNSFFVPLGTPASRQAALADAIQWGMSRGGLKQAYAQASLQAGTIAPSVVKSYITQDLAQQAQLKTWLAETGAP